MSSTKKTKTIPRPMIVGLHKGNIRNKAYLRELDHIRENTLVNIIYLSAGGGVDMENLQQCHALLKEYVDYAAKLGLKVVFRQSHLEGYFNAGISTAPGTPIELDQAQIFTIDDPSKAEGIVNDYEAVADENGYAAIQHRAKWARNKIRPLRNKVLRVYAFRKTNEGFYEPGSLQDVTEKILITNSRPMMCEVEFHGGKEFAGYTIFFMIVQYFNAYELFGGSFFEKKEKTLMEAYSDVPFHGVCMDEVGFLLLDTPNIYSGAEEPFRGRFYSEGQRKHYEDKFGIDLIRMLFDMRYAPAGDDKIRIKAINRYFDELRFAIIRNENQVVDLSRKLWGDDLYLSAHNTFHNRLDNTEVWHTACAWWDLPRDYGHTDENITFPVRMGIMLAAKEPLMLDMYYSSEDEDYYNHIIEGAPFNCREFHHPWLDKNGVRNITRKDFCEMLYKLDEAVAKLDDFQTVLPRLDLLVIFGNYAQNNWYPDYDARNGWDIDGTLRIQDKVDEMWRAGYRCALVPDYAIPDGRIKFEDGKITFNGHAFTHCLFLYPKYAKKETYDFLNRAGAGGFPIAAVGRADIDCDGEPAELSIPVYPDFDFAILEKLGCPRSAIPEGCIYTDGSFALVSKAALLENKPQPVDLTIDGVRYTGLNTGILAWRNGLQVATDGGSLQRH